MRIYRVVYGSDGLKGLFKSYIIKALDKLNEKDSMDFINFILADSHLYIKAS